MTRFVALLALAAAAPLAACADLTEARLGGPLATATVPTSMAQDMAPELALARLPAEAATVVSVAERREKDRLTQIVRLTGDATTRGANQIRVVATDHDPAVTRRATEEGIEAEIAAEFPGLDMRVSPRVIPAAGGPIGIASGRAADGGACVFAWQEAVVTPRGARSGGLLRDDDVDLSVRVRLCRRGIDEAKLIALVEGLSLRGDVATRGGATAVAARGVDALASAGYGGAPAGTASAFEPSIATEPPRRLVTVSEPRRPRPFVAAPAVRAAETVAAVRVPAPVTAPVAAKPAPAAPAPAVVANPIPLPSGG